MARCLTGLLCFTLNILLQGCSPDLGAGRPNEDVMSAEQILPQDQLPKSIAPFQSDEQVIWPGPAKVSTYETEPGFYLDAQSGVIFVRIDPQITPNVLSALFAEIKERGGLIVGQRPRRVELQLFVNSDAEMMRLYSYLKDAEHVVGLNLNMVSDVD